MESALRAALLESRQRWRDFVTLAADLVFETDTQGRLTFLAPDPALGWCAEALLHRPLSELLANPGTDPFTLRTQARGVKTWLRQRSGEPACFTFNLAPLRDPSGQVVGLRGAGRDVTLEERAAEAHAAALRRAGAVEALVRRVRQEVLAPRMLAATLEALPTTLGCAGAVVLELDSSRMPVVTQRHGADPSHLVAALPDWGETPLFISGPGGEPMALVPQPQRADPRQALLTWRASGALLFDADDRHLLLSLADLLFVTLGNQTLQRELELQARTESLTGLLNRRAFLSDLRRRLERRDHPGMASAQPHGALLFMDLDNFKPINDLLGHDAGDAALVAVANLLRDMVRPTDLIARFGGDEFVVWLDGADAATAEARAAAISHLASETLPALLRNGPTALTFSMGSAVHLRGSGETLAELLNRADAAMYAAKRAGRNCHVVAEPRRLAQA